MENKWWNRSLKKKLEVFSRQAELMPSVVIVQQLEPFLCVYMSQRGLNELGITATDLKEIGSDYLSKFFNLEDSEDYLKKLKKLLLANDTEESFTFFQQVRFKDQKDWVWHIGSTRIFFHDEQGKPSHIVTIAIPVKQLKHIPKKAERLLAQKEFFHSNLDKFSTLTPRETEILKLVAQGKSSPDISEELFISIQTVNTHRKSIKQKLTIANAYEFMLYAHSFDLF